MKRIVSLAAVAAVLAACPAFAKAPSKAPSASARVDAWIKKADKAFFDESVKNGQTEWVYETYITDDTAAIAADENAKMATLQVTNAAGAAKMAKAPGLSPETLRKLNMFRTLITAPVPSKPGAAEEYANRIRGGHCQSASHQTNAH